MRGTFVRALQMEMAVNDRIVLITGDLGFGVLRPIWDNYPDRIINAGIAEQSMVSMAAGLASTGRTVIVYSIGNFPTLRPLEQIRNDCAYHNADVKIVCVGGGFVYGSLGMSHHATEDLAVMRALPGVTCFAPGDAAEAEAVVPVMLRTPGTCYLRLGRDGEPQVHQGPLESWSFPRAVPCRKGTDIALFGIGGILPEVMAAAELLQEKGVSAEVLSFPCLKPIDREAILDAAKRFGRIVTAEEHNIIGGLGSAVCETVTESEKPCPVLRIGMTDTYTSVVGDQKYLREYYGIDSRAIAEKTLEFMK
ncbi:MAG: transketolase [Clostridia bacterium]|nr:transketolase [Clostridia bacterium]